MDINYTYINYNKTIKYLLFVLFSLVFIHHIFGHNSDEITYVLVTCAYLTIVYYILDSYFPCCNI
jgi:hypothetical protein